MPARPGLDRNPERREQIITFVEEYWENHGYAPTKAEISEAIGLSERATRNYIEALKEDGLLVEGKGHRTLRVLF